MNTKRQLLLVPLLVIALAGCGGGSDTDGVAAAGGPTSTANGGTDQDKALRYVQCLRGEGIDVADPDNGKLPAIEQGTVDDDKFAAAEQKCRQYRPTNAPAGDGVDAAELEGLRKVAQCMRGKGFPEYPDPDPKTGSISLDGTGIDPKDPKVKQAQDECHQLIPTPSGSANG